MLELKVWQELEVKKTIYLMFKSPFDTPRGILMVARFN